MRASALSQSGLRSEPNSTRSRSGASMDSCGFDLVRKGALHAPSRSSAVYLFRDADSRNGGRGQRRQAGHRRSSWQGASAQLRGVEAQPGRIVDQYWSASGRGGHIDQRHLARREGNQSLGGEVSSRVDASRRPDDKAATQRGIPSAGITAPILPTERKAAEYCAMRISPRRRRLPQSESLANHARRTGGAHGCKSVSPVYE